MANRTREKKAARESYRQGDQSSNLSPGPTKKIWWRVFPRWKASSYRTDGRGSIRFVFSQSAHRAFELAELTGDDGARLPFSGVTCRQVGDRLPAGVVPYWPEGKPKDLEARRAYLLQAGLGVSAPENAEEPPTDGAAPGEPEASQKPASDPGRPVCAPMHDDGLPVSFLPELAESIGRALEPDLDLLEREDPAVREAAKGYERTRSRILGTDNRLAVDTEFPPAGENPGPIELRPRPGCCSDMRCIRGEGHKMPHRSVYGQEWG